MIHNSVRRVISRPFAVFGIFAKRYASNSNSLIRRFQRKAEKKMANQSAQNFDALFVLDFEATCEKGKQIRPQEIIEFPCIKMAFVGNSSLRETARFHKYVKPIEIPALTPFCTELTGITQDMVEDEEPFAQVFKSFNAWLSQETDNFSLRFAFVTCGDWDLQTMLPNQCKVSNVQMPSYFNRWINIKRSCHAHNGTFPRGMAQMLKLTGAAPFQGRQHSGIDDTENIARAARLMVEAGHVFQTN